MATVSISLDGLTAVKTGKDTAVVAVDDATHNVSNVRHVGNTLTCTAEPVLWWVPQITITWTKTELTVAIIDAPVAAPPPIVLTPSKFAEIEAFAKAFP